MTYKDFAKFWINKRGISDSDSDYNGMLGQAVMELAEVMSTQGHSGTSASMVSELFYQLNQAYQNADSPEWQEWTKHIKDIRNQPNKDGDIECLCSTHLHNEPGKPCLGHGRLCPCTKILQEQNIKKEALPS